MQELNQNDKIKQMSYDMKVPSPKSRFTTNTGVGVDNTDVWLKVAGDKQGPSLLQDHHGREKVLPQFPVLTRFTISTMNVFRNVWFIHVALLHTVCFVFIKPSPNSLVRKSLTTHRTKLLCSFAFLPSWDLVDLRILFVTSVVSPSSFTLEKEIGILLETTFPFSLSKTQLNSPTLFMPANLNRKQKFLKARLPITTFGTFSASLRKPHT